MDRVEEVETVFDDGNRQTLIKVDGVEVVVITQGDGESDADYRRAIDAAIIDHLDNEGK